MIEVLEAVHTLPPKLIRLCRLVGGMPQGMSYGGTAMT